jgi:hypothetical protein
MSALTERDCFCLPRNSENFLRVSDRFDRDAYDAIMDKVQESVGLASIASGYFTVWQASSNRVALAP